MKRTLVIALAALLPAAVWAAEPPIKSDKDKWSYALGAQMGQDLKTRGVDVSPDMFARAMRDMMAGSPPALSEDDMKKAFDGLNKEMNSKRQMVGEKNIKDGAEFLKQNKSKPGIVELPSGVQYKVLKKADGKKPTAESSVVAHYRGTLINGTEFDNSIKRNSPATFPLRGVIKGWQEVLPMMPVGSKWQVFIPAALGYADRGAPPTIGPNETLIFEIELLEIKAATP